MISRLKHLWRHFRHHKPIHPPITISLPGGEVVNIRDRRWVHIKRILLGRGK